MLKEKNRLYKELKTITLNNDQQHAYKKILKGINKFNAYLIAGVTGSGKTEVYLALAKEILEKQKQVLFLVPEIGLTPQFVERIESRLGVHAALTHSSLNDSERSQTWLDANTGKARIIVGTRSAILLPCKKSWFNCCR